MIELNDKNNTMGVFINVDLPDWLIWFWFLVFNATLSNISVYHGDQF